MLAGESEISKIIKMNLLSSETVKIKIKDGMAFKIGRSIIQKTIETSTSSKWKLIGHDGKTPK